MHMYAKCDQNTPCGSRVMNIFTNCLRTDGRTHIVIIVQTQRSCNVNYCPVQLQSILRGPMSDSSGTYFYFLQFYFFSTFL